MKVCIILGAGGYAREIYWHAKATRLYAGYIFVDDLNDIASIHLDGEDWPIEKNWSFEKYHAPGKQFGFVVGVGDTRGKITLVEKAINVGLEPWPTIIHPSAIIQDPKCRVGVGGVIAAGCILTTNITIGDYVLLNTGVTVGHDSQISSFATCAPQVAIAGNVLIGRGANLGIGTVVREKISIAPFVTSGAQSCIVKNIEIETLVVAGVPADSNFRSSDK